MRFVSVWSWVRSPEGGLLGISCVCVCVKRSWRACGRICVAVVVLSRPGCPTAHFVRSRGAAADCVNLSLPDGVFFARLTNVLSLLFTCGLSSRSLLGAVGFSLAARTRASLRQCFQAGRLQARRKVASSCAGPGSRSNDV